MTNDPHAACINENVVLDTAGTIIYLGRLVEVCENAFVLEDADVHDCRDGHATKEVYISESAANGLSVNRLRVIVQRAAVMSVSKLSDVVCE